MYFYRSQSLRSWGAVGLRAKILLVSGLLSAAWCTNAPLARAQDDLPPPPEPADVVMEPPPVIDDGGGFDDSYTPPPPPSDSESPARPPGFTLENNEFANPPDDDGWTPTKTFSEAEKKAACQKHEGQYISYYGMVYHVEKCRFREIQSQEVIYKLSRKKTRFHVVDGDVLAKLEKGEPIGEEALHDKSKTRSCKELEGKYITYAHTDVYVVEKCHKRSFPDWETYIEHRKKQKRTRESILALTLHEFQQLKPGKDVVTILDNEFLKIMEGRAGVDVIPVDEACRGVNGKDVTYIDRIYRIEQCKKRRYHAEKFLRDRRGKAFKPVELSSEQWLSLPDGKPMDPNISEF